MKDAANRTRVGTDGRKSAAAVFALLFALSLSANAAQSMQTKALKTQLAMERQRDMTDVVAAMADIEVNLQKLLIASGASQSVTLLGETALLAQHVETGLSRLPLSAQASGSAMKFAGQMGEYVMTLATQVSGGGALSADDERQIEGLLSACQGLNAHLLSVGERLYTEPMQEPDLYAQQAQGWPDEALSGGSGIPYPSLIYDGPFSDGRKDGPPKGLNGNRITREQARAAAARYAGTTEDKVRDAADSGGMFEAFGFLADTPSGRVSVQVTGQGGHLLWMMPEEAAFEARISAEECLRAAKVYLADNGFGEMERCFVQQYDGMVVANFAAVQDGVILYPDQVKVQVSMESGAVVGAECSQYLMNHERRLHLMPKLTGEQARQVVSGRLDVRVERLCVIPTDGGELLCWEYDGLFVGERYLVYVDAAQGETAEILRVTQTQDGETAI
ncbi:MAG: germination protein YpeB [Clostridia bacterium]|nr:germination protein YpeB [Clostridia bacterium]